MCVMCRFGRDVGIRVGFGRGCSGLLRTGKVVLGFGAGWEGGEMFWCGLGKRMIALVRVDDSFAAG